MPPERQTMHRRGQSFDQHQRSPIRKQHHGGTVSMTNLGQIHGQQILREAQQQKIARPGQQQHNHTHLDLPISPECGIYTTSPNSMPGTPYENMTMNAMMHQNSQGIDYSHSQQFFSDMSMSMQHGMSNMGLMDENIPQYFQDTHIIHSQPTRGLAIDTRRMSQPDLRVQTQLRPHTPSHQIQTGESDPMNPMLGRLTISSTISSHTSLQPAHTSCTILTITTSITCFAVTVSDPSIARKISSRNHRERGVQAGVYSNTHRCFFRDGRDAPARIATFCPNLALPPTRRIGECQVGAHVWKLRIGLRPRCRIPHVKARKPAHTSPESGTSSCRQQLPGEASSLTSPHVDFRPQLGAWYRSFHRRD